MVDWKAYKVLYNIEPEQYEISFEEFKKRLTSTMNENFGGLLEEAVKVYGEFKRFRKVQDQQVNFC